MEDCVWGCKKHSTCPKYDLSYTKLSYSVCEAARRNSFANAIL